MKTKTPLIPLVPLAALGKRLKRARGAATQTRAAAKAGVGRITYLRAERGDNIRADAYIRLVEWAASRLD